MTTVGDLRQALAEADDAALVSLVLRPEFLASLTSAVQSGATVDVGISVERMTGNVVLLAPVSE